jgi:hypothetical protein
MGIPRVPATSQTTDFEAIRKAIKETLGVQIFPLAHGRRDRERMLGS